MICRVERTRYATLDALEVTDRFTATPGALEADIQICLEQLKRVAPPDALEATDKLVVWNRGDTQLRMSWKRKTDLSCATEENRNSGCFRSDTTLDALEATDFVFV